MYILILLFRSLKKKKIDEVISKRFFVYFVDSEITMVDLNWKIYNALHV